MNNEFFIQNATNIWKGENFRDDQNFSLIAIGFSMEHQELNLKKVLIEITDYPCTVVFDELFPLDEVIANKMKLIRVNKTLIAMINSKMQFKDIMPIIYMNALNGMEIDIIIGREKKEIPFNHLFRNDLKNNIDYPNLNAEEVETFLKITEIGIIIQTIDENKNSPKKLLPFMPTDLVLNREDSDL
ncbi:hypothetical protein ACQKM9_19625 [Viridibacillus sp. NPDC093762]|uniref:hypothetical protein n=1 Tax=Viridibacillus sp. NPDC093762 TaxID=3390720 RepID=UPI003D050C1E